MKTAMTASQETGSSMPTLMESIDQLDVSVSSLEDIIYGEKRATEKVSNEAIARRTVMGRVRDKVVEINESIQVMISSLNEA